jgi:hydantoinase/carbamoylase family amidase
LAAGPEIDAGAVVADLRELDALTGGPAGARRVCWGEDWRLARDWLGEKLGEIGLTPERDEAGNVWAYLEGEREPALALGSHLDSVPSGGWLDGCLGVAAALGVLRAWAGTGRRPPRTLALLDCADEEGARFGRSLFGSSALAGSLDPGALASLTDGEGRAIGEVLAGNGVALERALDAGRRLERIGGYLELHIEQGPVLESEGLPCAAVAGCAGVEREILAFSGQAAHAGTTPMDRRRDAGLAAAETALAVERVAVDGGGVGTTGLVELDPGIVTAVPGAARLSIDLRHADPEALARVHGGIHATAHAAAERRRCSLAIEPLWRIAPIRFDPGLVALAVAATAAAGGRAEPLISGALHDAAELARALPVAMIFSSSSRGLSHAKEEDTPEPDLIAAIEAFGELASAAAATDL